MTTIGQEVLPFGDVSNLDGLIPGCRSQAPAIERPDQSLHMIQLPIGAEVDGSHRRIADLHHSIDLS
jgi:hypothetical protein